jgi:hypothetical protein
MIDIAGCRMYSGELSFGKLELLLGWESGPFFESFGPVARGKGYFAVVCTHVSVPSMESRLPGSGAIARTTVHFPGPIRNSRV